MRYLLTATWALLFATSLSLANLVPNAGFEEGANGACAVWNVTEAGVPGDGGALASWTAEEAHTGKRSLKLQMTGDGEGFAIVGSPLLPVLVGYEYEVSFWYKGTGLRPETADRQHYSALLEDNFVDSANPRKTVANHRISVYQDSPEWQRASLTFRVAEPGAATVQLRFQLVPKLPGIKPVVYIDDASLEPLDASLPNPGFEAGQDAPEGWLHTETGNPAWGADQAHGGKHSVSLSQTPMGKPSAWYADMPCRPDRQYGLTGWIKTAKVTPNGTPEGAYLGLTFLDGQGTVIGQPARSRPLAGDNDWTQVSVEPQRAPAGAVFLRVAGEMVFCGGSAWFDDLELSLAPTEAAAVKRVAREVRGPQLGVTYAENLVKNPGAEEGADGKPAGWTYVGKPDPDWTAEELDKYYKSGYPNPNIGRGRGEWSEEAFAGKHSLLNISVEPPVSKRFQWYGLGEVNAYWQSDPMPCTPGQQYLASAWLKVTNAIYETWRGPIYLAWYDGNGNEIYTPAVRPAMELWSSGRWAWACTAPYTAPAGAATMRLRFTQCLRADSGTFGRMWGDNFAVWPVPEAGKALPVPPAFQKDKFLRWFFAAHQQVRPPYLPAPEYVPAGDTAYAEVDAAATGNLFFDPKQPASLTVTIRNPLAEQRNLEVGLVRYDWQGNRSSLPPLRVAVDAWGESSARVSVPAGGKYDCYYVEATVAESGEPTGDGAGRFAVLPRPSRPRYAPADSHWQVMPCVSISDWNGAWAKELGEMIKLAGYGSARPPTVYWNKGGTAEAAGEEAALLRPAIDFYKSLGLDVTVNVGYPGQEGGAALARLLGQEVAVWDVGAVEMANHGSPFRATGGMSDEEYDRLVGETVDGIRSVLPQAKILSGAIATDMEADVLKRWYAAGVAQKFDGFTYNTYMGPTLVIRNNLAEMDKHGDTRKVAWIEEIPAHDCPISGPGRRYGEKNGAANLVRTYVSLLSDFYPRFERITTWDFVGDVDNSYNMVTSDLAPRPSYQAMVVLTDKFGRAKFDRALGNDRLAIYRWREGNRTLGILWATVGEQSVTLETSAKAVTVTDLMGNATRMPVKGRLVTLNLTETPVYLEEAGEFTVSNRLQVSLTHAASALDGPPAVQVRLRNNGTQRLAGTVRLSGATALEPAQAPFDLAPGQEMALTAQVLGEAPISRRETYRAVATTKEGYVFAGVANLNFARAARATAPPALDGTWEGWEKAPVIRVADAGSVWQGSNPGESWNGPNDAGFSLRLLWDEKNLYLGVEATDDVFKPWPERGFQGFSGDSIEFALQPNDLLQPEAPFSEFELYLPGGQPPPRLNLRFPNREITGWTVAVKPTGHNGDVNYQVAIPWAEVGVKDAHPGKVISFAMVLNDTDTDQFTGGRGWLYWFGKAVALQKNPAGYGDVVLGE
jgi:hypothetical protein